MPPNTVYVGRPSKWGNPYPKDEAVNLGGGLTGAYEAFRVLVTSEASWPYRNEARTELAGKNLMCFCTLSQKCHADVLLEIANRPEQR